MDLKSLSQKLISFSPKMKINQPNIVEIFNVEVFEHERESYDPGVIYILELSMLSNIDFDSDCKNILIIKRFDDIAESWHQNNEVNAIQITTKSDIASVLMDVRSILQEHKKYNHYYMILHQLLFQNAGLQQIIETGSEIVGNPLLLQDISGRFICCSSHLNAESLSMTFVKDSVELTENIIAYKIPIATLSIIELVKEIHLNDAVLLQLVSDIISLEMQKNRYQYYFKHRTYEYILYDLIEERIDKTQPIEKLLAKSGMLLKDSMYLLTILPAYDQKLGNTIRELMNQLKAINPCSEFIMYNSSLLMLILKNTGEILDAAQLDSIRNFLQDNSLYGGLSFQFSDIINIKKYYLQTLRAIEMGQLLKKDAPLYFFEDYLFNYMLDDCRQDINLVHFTHPSLLALLDYDEKNETDLAYTFYQHIKQNGNHKAMADVLYVHPSTLIYRMTKIRKILRTEMNQDFLFQAEFSFKILEYLNRLPFLT